MELFPDHLMIAGKSWPVADLLYRENEAIPLDMRDLLREWYSESPYLAVQTSGSTGPPKTLFLAKTCVAASARRTLDFFQLQRADLVLLCLPLRYIAGKLMVIRALLGRLDLCFVDPGCDFSPPLLFPQGTQKRIRFAAMVAHQVHKLLLHPVSLAGIDTLLLGGSSLPPPLARALLDVRCACYIGYGMTETATHIALRRINGTQPSSWYRALPGIGISLQEDGRLTITMPGEDEPLITNDLAEIQEDDPQMFHILGRVDNVIISGGIKYIPEVLEKKLAPLLPMPFFITSLPDDKLGEKIVLVVQGKEDGELRRRIARRATVLDRYERPKEILFKERFLQTATGKIRRVLS